MKKSRIMVALAFTLALVLAPFSVGSLEYCCCEGGGDCGIECGWRCSYDACVQDLITDPKVWCELTGSGCISEYSPACCKVECPL